MCGANLNIKDKDGNTLLNYATYHRNHEMVKFLLNNNFNLAMKDKQGLNAVDLLCNYINDGLCWESDDGVAKILLNRISKLLFNQKIDFDVAKNLLNLYIMQLLQRDIVI